MPDKRQPPADAAELLDEIVRTQGQAMTMLLPGIFGQLSPGEATHGEGEEPQIHWAELARTLQDMWNNYQKDQAEKAPQPAAHYSDPAKWIAAAEGVLRALPISDPARQKQLWEDGLDLFQTVLGQYGIGPKGETENVEGPQMPRSDRRFADPLWRENPFFAVLHQSYLMLCEELMDMAHSSDGLDAAKKAQLVFATRALTDALSPSNFALTNPAVLARARETGGQSLVDGMKNMLRDLQRGQLSHTDHDAFELGGTIANTPGKVIHETPLYQLIQYMPTTEKVLKVPLVIFPPWINRFYILDLNQKKSFVRWAVEQGISTFMVSWKSADASMADLTWDDYIAAQMDAIDHVCTRLNVPSVHAIGYCVAGTTLAATLAVMARKGIADKVESATFFTAQVDFEDAGDLKHFVDDSQIEVLRTLATDGYVDGRYLAATFNLLRGNDLIWRYVENNYLKGRDYPAFDLLYWNGDYTNLPAKWHRDYLRELYRDNRLIQPDSLQACGVPIDLRKIETPCYIQAGREDHIAPAKSVWKLTRHLAGPWRFLLAGSGHIAGVVNPPSANKYQYWTNDGPAESLAEFSEGAAEHPGSWWPDWLDWLIQRNPRQVAVRGKRKPGSKSDPAIEDAPGRYVKSR
ncbi:MAG: class I poly(R)-hydroxyalkanoic acid synthase [Sphingomonadaceae bacterium]|nr:class I poly(R)-hydroxyalkanoic acid synthase [Sphingomonadaceae bacterium]